MAENETKKRIEVIDFIRDLNISDEDRETLVACFATTISMVAFETARSVTAACMGEDPNSEQFNAFFNNNIAQIISVEENQVFSELMRKVMPNYKATYSSKNKGDESHE